MKLKRWLTILLFTILSLSTFAQGSTAVYPVEVSTFITPPYGTCLKDFVGSQRFQVHVLLRDLTKKNDDFVIIMSVKDMGGKTIFRSNVGQFTFANRGTMIVPAEVNTHILQNLFQPANIEIGEKYATNCFPEGAYTISFQAFDAKFYNIAKRRIPLSRESVTQLFMQSSTDKVYLVYPYKDETICSTINGSVINYQWQPANPTGEIISYHLEVVKLESEFEKQSPKSAFARTTRVLDVDNLYRSIYTDHILTTNYTEGNFYAWRVTVKKGYEQTASTAETNQEIRVFEYRCNALEPVVDTYDPLIIAEKQLDKKLDKITLEEVSNTGADALLKWKEDPAEIRKKYCGVGIEIRKFGGEKWTAFKNTTTEEFEYSLSQLSRNVSYEARAHYIQCPDETHEDSIYGPYSDIIEFSIPKENDESECGSPIPDLSDCTDKKAKILRAGDTIIANGTKVFVDKITEYSADSTEITGEGHVCFPIITNIQLRMKFDKIKINCAGELANGEIHAVYDVSTCAMIDLEELTGEGFTGGTEKSASESQINDMKDFDKGSAGDYFKDEKGTVYMKDENGEKVEIGKILTLDNTQFSFDHDRLASQDHFVIFSNPTPETIAFDNDKDGFYRAIRGSNYSSYSDKYIIPYLANIPGLIKTLNAEEVRVNDRVDLFEDVKFVIESSDGSYLELTKTVLDEKTNKFEIKVPGTSDYEHLTYVRVIGKPKDSEQYQIAGKLIVCNFKKQTHNLVIVPTLSSYSVDESKIANELNRIYGRIGISFNVTVDKSFVDKQEVLELLENGLDISTDDQEKHSWDVESPDMKKIRRLYQESHSDISTKKAAYLFLVNRPEDKYSSVDGDMPRNQSVGYIFMKDKNELTDVRLIAHELGHGVFRLQHTFAYKGMDETKKKTDNLMDYNPSNPDFLAYYQWNVLQDSAFFVWKALQDDEDGMFFDSNCKSTLWLTRTNDNLKSKVEDHFALFEELYNSNNLDENSYNSLTLGNKSVPINGFPKWTATGRTPDYWGNGQTNLDFIKQIHDNESEAVELTGLEKDHVYIYKASTSEFTGGESRFTVIYIYAFKDNPTISNYKCFKNSEYHTNNRVKICYKDCVSGDAIVCFYDENENIDVILQLKSYHLSSGKQNAEFWRDYLLKASDYDEKVELDDRYIVSNELAYVRKSDGSIVTGSVIPLASEVEMIETVFIQNLDTLVRVKCIYSDDDYYSGKEFCTYKSNLTQIQSVDLSKPLNVNAMYSKFPYNINRDDIPASENIAICSIDARCGKYYRVVNTTFPDLDLQTDTTWQGCWVDTGYFYLDNLHLTEIVLYVKRTNSGNHSTTGVIRSDDGIIRGYSAEQPRGSDDECKQNCNDDTKPYQCHCIIEGVYSICLNTYGAYANHSLRINQTVPRARGGILVHKGQDDAEGWSQGCILALPNQPVEDVSYVNRFNQGRNNTAQQSADFVDDIYDWMQSRINSSQNTPCKIIVTKNF